MVAFGETTPVMGGQDRAVMDEAAVRNLLDQLRAGQVDADEVVRRLRLLPFADLGYATVDHHRELQAGSARRPSTGRAKQPAQCVGIVSELLSGGGADPGRGGPVVLSRAESEQIAAAVAACPGGMVAASTVVWRPAPTRSERVLVLTAGTADLPVAEECHAVLGAFGFRGRSGLRRGRGRRAPAALLRSSCCRPPTPSWWWPAWRGPWPAWSAA